MENTVAFKIQWSHGQTERFQTYDDAVTAIQSVLGAAAEIGHDGDILCGGERTLFWADAETAENDDGALSKGIIVAVR